MVRFEYNLNYLQYSKHAQSSLLIFKLLAFIRQIHLKANTMKKFALTLITIILLSTSWGVVRFIAMTEGVGLEPIASNGDLPTLVERLTAEVDSSHKGNVALAIISNGKVVKQHFISKGLPVDANTIFGVASVSKWVTALGVMKLVEQNKVSLDTPVSQYLTRWSLPPSEFSNDEVTLRRLLSHTAGIEDGLGHNGFAPGEPVQPLVEHLTQAQDADEGVSGRVAVTAQPGEKWKYSGGSYNLIQLIIEEVSGQSFPEFIDTHIFKPLDMKNSSFHADRLSSKLAQYFDESAEEKVYPNYTSLAATGMYTTINDMLKLVKANFNKEIRPAGTPELMSEETLTAMRQPLADVSGLDIWGAGVMLFAPSESGYVIGHGGKSPNLNATVRFEPSTGDGFIMFQTGNNEAFASNMATTWTLWLTGKPDIYMVNNLMDDTFRDILIGAIIIAIFIVSVVIVRSRKTVGQNN